MPLRVPPAGIFPGRWPAPVAAWAWVAAGHLIAAWISPPHEGEGWLRVAALVLGTASLWTSRAGPGAAGPSRTAAAGLACAALLAVGGALGLESTRRHAPLEVHPRHVGATLRGYIADASRADGTPATVRLDVAEVEVGTRVSRIEAAVRVVWPRGTPPPTWAVAGTPISVRGILRPLEDARNPGGSAPGRWLEREGLAATFEVEPGSVEPWTPAAGSTGRDRRAGARLAAEVRRSLGRLYDAHAPATASALARGMLLGDRAGIDAETRDAFRNAGTLHILSISGLHVCIVAGFVAVAARALRLGAATGTAIELGALAAYVVFVGAPAPALRSALLWVIARGARLAGRGGTPFAAWGAAGLLLHLADPRLPLDLGFLLSFGAVLGLEAGAALAPGRDVPRDAPRRARWTRAVAVALLGGVGASLGTLPVEAAAFGSLPIAGPIANLVVIPLTTLFLAEAILLALLAPMTPPAVGDCLGGALGALGDLLLLANDRLGGRVAPIPIHASPSLPALGLAYLALLALAVSRHPERSPAGDRGATLRAATLRVLLAAAVAAFPLAPGLDPAGAGPGGPRLLSLDVGQGDATVLVGSSGLAVAIDAGPRSRFRDEGRLTVEPALRAEGVHGRIIVVSSHGHLDHEGGIEWLAERRWVARVLENGGGAPDRARWRAALRDAGAADEIVRSPSVVVAAAPWRVDVQGPRAGRDPSAPPEAGAEARRPTSANAGENDRSLVAVATVAAKGVASGRGGSTPPPPITVLLPGDLERDGEEAWLGGGLGRADVLKVPHHGSRTSSTEPWVNRVRPRVAIVSVGEGNRHRHPSAETLRRYRRAGARVLRTDREGAIRLSLAGGEASISTRAHPAPRPLPADSAASLSRYFDFP